MAPDITKAIRQFLNRVQLQGAEVPAYIRIMQELDVEDARVANEVAKAQDAGATLVEAVSERP